MTPNTMTLDEVRDELARRDGWEYTAPHKDAETGRVVHGVWSRGKSTLCFHPVIATRDGAAAALPKGWTLHALEEVGSLSGWSCAAIAHYPLPAETCFGHAPDELTARYRLALACRIAEEGK